MLRGPILLLYAPPACLWLLSPHPTADSQLSERREAQGGAGITSYNE